jgi:hypothetical protein
MESKAKRRIGRPKAVPQTGPLVLEGGRARVKVELEIAEGTLDELREYALWVEQSLAVETKDGLFRTVDFALRDVFRRDRLWQEQRKRAEQRESANTPKAAMAPAPVAPALPLPSAFARPASATPTTTAAASR